MGAQHVADEHVAEEHIFKVAACSLGLLQPELREFGINSLAYMEDGNKGINDNSEQACYWSVNVGNTTLEQTFFVELSFPTAGKTNKKHQLY